MPDRSPRATIWKHIAAIETCMMVTYTADAIRARPMRGIARPEQNLIWFFSSLELQGDEEIKNDPRSCLTFADVANQKFVSLTGKIARVLDRDTIEALWNDGAAAYFPKGPDDPQIVLLRFEPESGEYWDAPSSAIVLAIKFLEAKITGERPQLGASGTVQLP